MTRDGPGSDVAITVVTVVRDDLERLKRTWESVTSQTLPSIEWVVIDGASTDGTVEWLGALNDDRMRFRSEPDSGIYDAMNAGLSLAQGELITFLNAGDYYLRETALADIATKHDAEGWIWGHGLGAVVNAGGKQVRPVHAGYPGRLRYAFGRSVVIHQTVFVQTEVVRRLGGFDTRFPIAADVHLTMKLGRICDPQIWSSVDVAYQEGGVSDQDAGRSLGDMHRARVDVFGMGAVAEKADAAWTGVVVGYVKSRRAIKAVARRVFGERSVEWWVRR